MGLMFLQSPKYGSAIECPVIVYKFRDTALLSGLTGTSRGVAGSVAFFTVNSLVVKRRLDLELVAVEFLWIEFRIKHLDILCGVCYRPRDNHSVSLDDFFEYSQLVVDKIRQIPKQYVIVMLGDFIAYPERCKENNLLSYSVFKTRMETQSVGKDKVHQEMDLFRDAQEKTAMDNRP